jgi:prophage regulatory protein
LGSPAFLILSRREPHHPGASHMTIKRTLITYDDLRSKGIVYSKPHLWKLEKANKFPRRVMIGARYAYVESEVDAWIDSMIAARDAGRSAA